MRREVRGHAVDHAKPDPMLLRLGLRERQSRVAMVIALSVWCGSCGQERLRTNDTAAIPQGTSSTDAGAGHGGPIAPGGGTDPAHGGVSPDDPDPHLAGDILKVEMQFDNLENSWFADDYRDVDLELESPLGYACTKPKRTYTPDGQGNFTLAAIDDYCAMWRATGLEGNVSWRAYGMYEEPERVTLYSVPQHAAEGGYVVRVHYVEDCAHLPSELITNLFNVSMNVIVGVIRNQTDMSNVPITPEQIRHAVTENCYSRAGTQATVSVYINGVLMAQRSVALDRKGDFVSLDIVRRVNSTFAVVPNSATP